MTRRVRPLTVDELDGLPSPCRSCTFWELDPLAAARAAGAAPGPGTASKAEIKESWVSATLLEWGSCGLVLVVDEKVVGYISYAPPALVARSMAFPTSPIATDAVQLMAVRVAPEFRGRGFGVAAARELRVFPHAGRRCTRKTASRRRT